MRLDDLEQHWNALGHEDPLWAIMSVPDKQGGTWDLDEFLATGRHDVSEVLAQLELSGAQFARDRALDFGCGVGRLTQPLSEHFARCDGVDLAASMIEQAVRLNRRPDRCHFHHSAAADLRTFDDASFDLVLSLLVFQHMEPALMRSYMGEVVRVLKPGGVAYFNLPDHVRLGDELPRRARRARIEAVGAIAPLEAGQLHELTLEVRNESPLPWPAEGGVTVGNHWLTADGSMLTVDDGRAGIMSSVAPRGSQRVALHVHAPAHPGEYLLEVDVLQEHRGWFAAAGSSTLRVPVTVTPTTDAGDPESAPAPLIPRIEMHVMSRRDAVATIEAAGGIVLDVIEKDRCGPSTPSYDYVVGRAGHRDGPRPRSEAHADDRLTTPPSGPAAPADHGGSARAMLAARADLTAATLTSRLGPLGRLSIGGRRLLRRALFEVLHRQTEFNQASRTVLGELERELAALRSALGARDAEILEARRRIAALEAKAGESDDRDT